MNSEEKAHRHKLRRAAVRILTDHIHVTTVDTTFKASSCRHLLPEPALPKFEVIEESKVDLARYFVV